MDLGTLNDLGITLAGILGVALINWLGKKSSAQREAAARNAAKRDKGASGEGG